VTSPPERAAGILRESTLCWIAARTPRGPHVTPLVFAVSEGALWLTTSRRSVKARAWARDPSVAGLVREGTSAVSFAGRARTYDALEPRTWLTSMAAAPSLAAATVRYTGKNARFFAGYAVDAREVPLAWTPPGRVFARIDIERGAVIEGDEVVERWGRWPGGPLVSGASFRASSKLSDPLADVPGGVAARLGRHGGEAALAVEGEDGLAVLPAGWAATDHELYAAMPRAVAELAGAAANDRVALSIDSASWWRAADMAGAMIQGTSSAFAVDELATGSGSAGRLAAAAGAARVGSVLVRVRPRRVVWWLGWSSGAISVAGVRGPAPAPRKVAAAES
jgi:hypothetical protein